jgi:hypothetical protein
MSFLRAEWLRFGLFLLAVSLGSVSAVAAPEPGRGADPVVTNLDDGGPGSLRDEIATAQPGDTISFSVQGTDERLTADP